MKEKVFTKEQLLQSQMFKKNRDALQVCLKNGESYTIKQAETALKRFMKGRV